MSMTRPIETKLDAITVQIQQAHERLAANKDFDLLPIIAVLDEVQSAAAGLPIDERSEIAHKLNDIGTMLSELEDKINRNNSELTNLINTLDSG